MKKLLLSTLSLILSLAILIIPVTVGAISIDKADKPITTITNLGYQYRVVDGKGDNNGKNNRENDYIEIVGYKGDNTSSVSIISSISYTYSDGDKRTLPVAKLGYDAFRDFNKIETVSIPNSVVEIGYGVFHGCTALKEITIPNSVTAIGDFTFSNCSSLSKITFGTGLKAIGKFAFAECNSLKSVTIPNTVTFIDDSAFTQCANLETFNMGNGVTEIGDLVLFANPKLKNLTISNKLSTVAYMMCKECTSLTSVTIPEGVKKLDFAAFKDCTNLTTVSLPATLKEIDYCVFEGCKVSSITYNGSVDNYNRITKGKENGSFETATVNGQSNSKKTAKLTGAMKGDADADGKFNIKDVTYTQKYIAEIKEDIADEADYNGDGEITINDATTMQRDLAKFVDNWGVYMSATENGEAVQGHILEVKDENGVVVETWTTTNKAHQVNLARGKTYIVNDKTTSNEFECLKFTVEDVEFQNIMLVYDKSSIVDIIKIF